MDKKIKWRKNCGILAFKKIQNRNLKKKTYLQKMSFRKCHKPCSDHCSKYVHKKSMHGLPPPPAMTADDCGGAFADDEDDDETTKCEED